MSFWRKEDPELEGPDGSIKRIVKGGMWSAQRDWWNLENQIRLLVGGYGSGKTRTLCKWIIATALQNTPAWSAIVSPSFPLAKRTVIPTITELLDGKCALRGDMSYRHNKSDHMFKIRIEGLPEATVLYLSGDDPDALKGPNLGSAGIDEPFIQAKGVFSQMHARIRDPRASIHALGMSGTPEDLNWGYDIADGTDKGKYDIGVVHADTRQNLALPPGYTDSLIKSYDEKTAQAYIEGKFVSLATGRVFYAFDDENIRKPYEGEFAGGTPFAGMDFNVNPMSFVVGVRNGERVHIFAEYELPNADTEYACSELKAKHPEIRMVYPDPAGQARHTNAPGGITDFHLIRQAGLFPEAPRASWPLRDSYNSVNRKLDDKTLTINPRCVRLINYLRNYSHEKKRKQTSMSHLLDAMRYPITYLYPVYRPATSFTEVVGL